jgi:ADP-ribose pyrophosphatase YjhB (NUDIX family)/predicted kinase
VLGHRFLVIIAPSDFLTDADDMSGEGSSPVFSYAHPRPAVTADAVIVGVVPGALSVLLIERGASPYAGDWALPGGHVEFDEAIEAAVARELSEETGLVEVPLVEFGAFGTPGRDPRGHVISIAYVGTVRPSDHGPKAGDDARDVAWFDLGHLPPLAFDHAAIIETALIRLGYSRPLPTGRSGRPTRPGPAPVEPGPALILVAGLTAAGKSSFSRALAALAPSAVHLDAGDTIRLELTNGAPSFGRPEANWVHEATRSMAEGLLAQGYDVIVDATGLTPDDRAFYLDIAHPFGARAGLVWLDTDDATAAIRLANRAAGLDQHDRSTADALIRDHLRTRLNAPVAAEADDFWLVTPDTAEAAVASIAARLGAGRSNRTKAGAR